MEDHMRDDVKWYAFNLFAFPHDHFEGKTAEELRISEEARQELIRLQHDVCKSERKYNTVEDFLKEIEAE